MCLKNITVRKIKSSYFSVIMERRGHEGEPGVPCTVQSAIMAAQEGFLTASSAGPRVMRESIGIFGEKVEKCLDIKH
jgi:hypothetical protein